MPLIDIKDIDPSVLSPAEFRQYKICCAAIWCLRHEENIVHEEIRDANQYAQLKPPPYVPTVFDCTFFVAYCYFCAKSPDPFETGYKGISTTNELYRHGVLVGGPNVKQGMMLPGDITFEGKNGNFFTHVCLYVGGGKVISHGGDYGPVLRDYKNVKGAAPFQAVRRYPI